MIRVLYLHGFASSPHGRKATAVRSLVEAAGIELVTPDLNQPSFRELSFDAMATHAYDAARASGARAIVGSSLGALVTLETIRRGFRGPAVLVAPALGVAARWLPQIPDGDPVRMFHHGEEAELPIHRRFFEEVSSVDVDFEPPPVPVTVIMGRRDESVPFHAVRDTWDRWTASGNLRPGSLFVDLADGDHRLTGHEGRVADEIRSALCRP